MTAVAIVVSTFNQPITSSLYRGAEIVLQEHGVFVERFDVPGAFELPLAAQYCANSKKYDGIVCLGCVIQGDTPHFDYVCSEAARGIMQVGLGALIPVIFGVLTTQNIEQALARSVDPELGNLRAPLHSIKPSISNKGVEAAHALLQMLELKKQIG